MSTAWPHHPDTDFTLYRVCSIIMFHSFFSSIIDCYLVLCFVWQRWGPSTQSAHISRVQNDLASRHLIGIKTSFCPLYHCLLHLHWSNDLEQTISSIEIWFRGRKSLSPSDLDLTRVQSVSMWPSFSSVDLLPEREGTIRAELGGIKASKINNWSVSASRLL